MLALEVSRIWIATTPTFSMAKNGSILACIAGTSPMSAASTLPQSQRSIGTLVSTQYLQLLLVICWLGCHSIVLMYRMAQRAGLAHQLATLAHGQGLTLMGLVMVL